MGGVTATVLGFVMNDAREELYELLAGEVDPWLLTGAEVIDLIDARYPGGWQAFLRDSAV